VSAGLAEPSNSSVNTAAPPDLEALLCILRTPPDFTALRNPQNWPAIRDLATQSGVATILASLASDQPASAGRNWCQQTLRTSWLRHEQSLLDLEATLAILDNHGIQPLVLKGPVLARRYYDPPYLRRPSNDVDLAVRNSDLERACSALAEAGYSSLKSLAETRRRTHHVELFSAGKPCIELHFHLTHGAHGIPVEEFFDRAVRCVTPSGRTILVLSEADQLLHMVLHFAHGRNTSLFHLYEIRHLWERATPAVRDEAASRAAAFHFSAAFVLADRAVRARWGAPLLTGTAPLRAPWLQWLWGNDFFDRFEREFFNRDERLDFASRLRRRWFDIQMTDRPADALRLLMIFLRAAAFQVGARLRLG